jgi:UDP-glucose 4-epimerase
MVSAVGAASGMRWASLRYFNVAGAASPQLGDPGVFNLIPLVFQALTRGQRPQVFGADYPTPDGTCIRDYVHVVDLADAHLVAARELTAGRSGLTWNVGRGEGSSVLEVMAAVAEVTGLRVDPVVVARRRGDPARIVASAARIRTDVGWAAERDLHDMVASAWTAWVAERGRPGGAA